MAQRLQGDLCEEGRRGGWGRRWGEVSFERGEWGGGGRMWRVSRERGE